jgi:hypothetical protein
MHSLFWQTLPFRRKTMMQIQSFKNERIAHLKIFLAKAFTLWQMQRPRRN